MSRRALPTIQSFNRPEGLAPDIDPVALDRWNPAIRAAAEGDANVISIYGTIGQDFWTGEGVTAKRVAAALRAVGGQDVTVNINSPGGDFFEGTAIYSLLREHPYAVTVKVLGLAASAASVIAMAGDRIEISPVGFLMIHNTWVIAAGNRLDLRKAADTLEPFDSAMAALYADRAGVKKSVAAGWMDDERWFGGEDAVAEGLADALLPSAVGEDKAKAGTNQKALVRAEISLARAGLSRSERRKLLADITGGMPGAAAHPGDGMPGAAATDDDAKPGAGELNASIERMIASLKPKKG